MSSQPNAIPSSRALASVRGLVPLAEAGSIYLLQGERKVLRSAMQELVDRFAMQEPVQVIVGGNWISFDGLPLLLGERAGSLYEILDHIFVSRAETCYQMLDTLLAIEPSQTPLIITDMLASFYEEDLIEQEVGMLLKKCLERINHLSQFAPVLVDADGNAARPKLLALLEECADTRFYFEAAAKQPQHAQITLPGLL